MLLILGIDTYVYSYRCMVKGKYVSGNATLSLNLFWYPHEPLALSCLHMFFGNDGRGSKSEFATAHGTEEKSGPPLNLWVVIGALEWSGKESSFVYRATAKGVQQYVLLSA